MNNPRTRKSTLAMASLLAASSLLVVPAGPATADTGEMRACTTEERRDGYVMRSVALTHKAFQMTHAERKRIPAGVGWSRSVTMSTTKVIAASIGGSATVKADAGAFFAKASVEATVSVATNGSKTSADSTTETFTVPKASFDRVFVFYTGNDVFAFRAHKRKCNLGGQDDYWGNLTSWNVIDESGAVRCPHSRYRKGSIPYQVTLGAGC